MANRLNLFAHQLHDHYEELTIGDDVYVKRWDNRKQAWTVIHYTVKSFQGYKAWKATRITREPNPNKKMSTMKFKRPKVTKTQHEKNQARALILIREVLGQPTKEQLNLLDDK